MRNAALFKFLSRFAVARGGNVLITTALALPVLVGSMGLGVEVSSWYAAKRMMQNAADSAAIAAATRADTQYFDDEARAVAVRYGFENGTWYREQSAEMARAIAAGRFSSGATA